MDEISIMSMTTRTESSWRFLQSWCDADNRLHGIIATYWDSSETCTEPHVMNHFPVIEGLRILYDRFGENVYRDKAAGIAEFLLDSYDPSLRLFQNAWGDIPGKHTGTVHQAAAAGAILDLYAMTGEERYLRVAVDSLKSARQRWPGLLLNGVANQVLKHIQSVVKLKQLAPTDFLLFEKDLHEFKIQLETLVRPVLGGGRLLDQSVYSCLQMTVYEVKCLHGLKAMADAGIERDWAVSLINSIVRGIIDTFYAGSGVFISHRDHQPGISATLVRYSAAALRRVPWPDRGLWVEVFRRKMLDQACNQSFVLAPVWLARIADLPFVLGEVSQYLEFDVSSVRNETIHSLTINQLAHGGVPNSVGPWMNGWRAWERLVCCTRWNAYAFRLFCSMSCEKPTLTQDEIEPCEWGDSFVNVREDRDVVCCCIAETGKEVKWSKPI